MKKPVIKFKPSDGPAPAKPKAPKAPPAEAMRVYVWPACGTGLGTIFALARSPEEAVEKALLAVANSCLALEDAAAAGPAEAYSGDSYAAGAVRAAASGRVRFAAPVVFDRPVAGHLLAVKGREGLAWSDDDDFHFWR